MPQNVEPLETWSISLRGSWHRPQGATRMAYEVMAMPDAQAMELAKAIEHAKKDLHRCRICQDYTADEVCRICASPKRDRSTICVVEARGISRPLSAPTNTTGCTMYCTA